MKKRYIVGLLLTALFSSSIHCMNDNDIKKPESWDMLTCENTLIAFDLDDTIIEKKAGLAFNVAIRGLWSSPRGLYYLAKNKNETKNIASVEGATMEMIWLAIQSNNKGLQNFVPQLLYITATSHRLKKGTPELFTFLKEKQYELAYATNKDLISYFDAAQSLDTQSSDVLGYLFSQAADKVLVVYPNETVIEGFKNFLTEQESKNFKEGVELPSPSDRETFQSLVRRTISAKQTDTVQYTHFTKPDLKYFKKLRTMTDKKYIVFFDDKQENVDAANKTDNMIGVKVKGPQDIAKALINLKIIESDDIATPQKGGYSYASYLLGAGLVAGGAYVGYQKFKSGN